MTGNSYGEKRMNAHVTRPDRAGSGLAGGRPPAVDPGPSRPAGRARRLRLAGRTDLLLPASAALAGVLTQIAYPLLSGTALRTATVLSVLLLAAAAAAHAGVVRGWRAAVIVPIVAGGLGLAAETIGVHTGFPFGAYSYADTLGPRLAGVPLVVPLAWTMLAYPCLLLGRRLAGELVRDHGNAEGPAEGWDTGRKRVLTAGLGGLGLAGWDLYLDPQMVAQGHWSWVHPTPALPGVPGVPLTNYAGWFLVAVLMIAALDRALAALPIKSPRDLARITDPGELPRDLVQIDNGSELIPAAVLAWTWCGSAVGNLFFFGRPWVALYGGLVMGAVVLPYLLFVRAAASTKPRTKDLT